MSGKQGWPFDQKDERPINLRLASSAVNPPNASQMAFVADIQAKAA